MKSSRAVVLRYARALLDLGNAQCIDTIKILANMKDEKIVDFLRDPTIPPSLKSEVVGEVFEIKEKCQKFLEVIFEHKRFNIFKDLYEVSWKLWLRKNNKEEVKVESAQQLSEKEIQKIEEVIKKVRRTEPVIEFLKNEKLLAGIVIDFEDSVVDMSAAGALKKAASLMYGG